MKWMSQVCGCALLLCSMTPSLVQAAPAQADPAPGAATSDDLSRAKALFTQGQREYNLGHHAAALAIFEQAYKIKPLPQLLYNIAQCHRLLGNLEQARRLYLNFLNTAAADNPGLEDARRLFAEVDATLKAQAQTRLAPPTALATQEVPTVAPGSLDRAVHASTSLPAPPRVGAVSAVALVAPPPANPPQRPSLALPLATVGVAVAAGAIGAVFGLQTKSSVDDMNSARTAADYAAAKSAADGSATKSTIAWVAAGALAAVGTALFIWRF